MLGHTVFKSRRKLFYAYATFRASEDYCIKRDFFVRLYRTHLRGSIDRTRGHVNKDRDFSPVIVQNRIINLSSPKEVMDQI